MTRSIILSVKFLAVGGGLATVALIKFHNPPQISVSTGEKTLRVFYVNRALKSTRNLSLR